MTTRDCQTCGACCATQRVFIRPTDTQVPVLMRDGAFMRQQFGRCIALEGRLGKLVGCKIYGLRPDVCRTFKPDSEGCKTVRSHVLVCGMEETK